jgi:hypothetical protein
MLSADASHPVMLETRRNDMKALTRKLAVVSVGIAALVGSLGLAPPASAAASDGYSAGIWTVKSPRTGRQLGKVGFKGPYCESTMNSFYGRVLGGVGGTTCYFGSVDVIENTSNDVFVYRWTEAQYRTRTALNTYTPWTKVNNTGTWSWVRCDDSLHSGCGNDTGASVCFSLERGYHMCSTGGSAGKQTWWTDAQGDMCGRYADHTLATVGCYIPVSIGSGEQLRTITHVYFYERSTNQWWYASLVRTIP